MSKVCTKHDKRRYTGGIKDSISDNNKVWDGTPNETTIELEVRVYAAWNPDRVSDSRISAGFVWAFL